MQYTVGGLVFGEIHFPVNKTYINVSYSHLHPATISKLLDKIEMNTIVVNGILEQIGSHPNNWKAKLYCFYAPVLDIVFIWW